MKIRIIKKLAKQGRLNTPKLSKWFNVSYKHNKSIRRAIMRGAYINGHMNLVTKMMMHDIHKDAKINWTLIEP